MKKVLAFLLVCLMLLPSLIACDAGTQPAETTGTAVTNAPVTTADPNAPNLPDVEEIGDISGDFNILVAGNWDWNDFASEGESGTVVDAAIYRRNEYIREKYDVEILNDYIVRYASNMGQGDGYVKIYRDYIAGESTYDAAMVGTYDVATLAYNGYLQDLNDMKYLDLSKPYWDQKIIEDLSMNGKMFYTTGDISVMDNRSTYVLFFNKAMIGTYGLEDPYQLVRDNEWTLEKFGTMVKSVGEDVDMNGIYDRNDIFGLLTPTDTHIAILSAAQERVCTINDEGSIGLTLYNERVVNLYDQYMEIVGDHAHSYNYQYNYITGATGLTSTNEERIGMFNTQKALFYSHTMFYMDYLRDLESDFGILPYPKFDATQENYGNLVSAWHSYFLCVPVMNKDMERSAIILEELAYQGKRLLTPAYYEKTLVGQYTRDEESAEMLDIIFANLVYDIGIYYNIGGYKDQLTAMVRTGKSLTTIYEAYKRPAEVKIDKINKFFQQTLAAQ